MCDLIDLNSPDTKVLLSSRLASPLIPIPRDAVCNIDNKQTNKPSSLMVEKRDSLENNPFDMVLHKTTEYIQKQDDPFEQTLEKALQIKCKKNTSLNTCPIDLPNDYILKQKIHKQKLKMNKTLDEPLINNQEPNQNNTSVKKIINENNLVTNLENKFNHSNGLSNDLKCNNVIPTIDIQDVNLSILNHSIMNDVLFETEKELSENLVKSTLESKMLIDTGKNKINSKQLLFSNTTLKIPKFRRSLSQGEAIPQKGSQYLNQLSLIEPRRIGSDSRSITFSPNPYDLLNEGFLKNSSGNSVFSSLSNISSIPKLNSVSSTINSSMITSNETLNRTFLESCSLEESENIKLNDNVDLNKDINFVLPAAKTSMILTTNGSTKTSISDLIDQFNKLKAKVSINSKNEKCDVDNKLVDVDIFIPDNNCSKEHSRNSISDASSDSVFLEGSKINKSILQEEKFLSKSFEELALRSSSGFSIDDLIASNPSWISELIPGSDDEVENLIELPISPDGNNTKSKSLKVTECGDNDSDRSKKQEISNKMEKNIKDLEMEFVEPISKEKRLTLATLLLDLKKFIKTENNIEADELLKNLEKALGINCDNNTELLTTCLNATNNLAKSPQKSSNTLKIIKNVAENNMEHSQEDNLSGKSTESIKESSFSENINFNEVNTSKCIDNQKYLSNVNSDSKYETPENEHIKVKKDENETNTQNMSKKDLYKNENINLLNERMIFELLANIGKLLNARTEEYPTLDILKSLGKALNFASNNCNANQNVKTDNTHVEIQQTPRKSESKFENKTHLSILSKSTNRLSLDVESKNQPTNKKCIRRSVSISQTSSVKNELDSLTSTNKSTSQLKEVTKRFPSDPGFVSPRLNKKTIAGINKNESEKDTITKTVITLDLQKEKTSAISTVKNKLKKKIGSDVTNKKGPMKAILPIGNMQKRETVNKTSSSGIITPPQSHKIISSTPNSTNNELTMKKSRSSKPVASSTPDIQNSKTQKVQLQITNSPKKRNFSCDISPVSTLVNKNNKINNSPRRSSKLPSPKRTTPKRRSTESGIPKSQTPPVNTRLNSSFEINQYDRLLHESPQRSLYKTLNSQKSSPISIKKNKNNKQQSPLRDSNKLIHTAKPINLISKLQWHNIGANVMEKENNYI